jgi:hypothetical protein
MSVISREIQMRGGLILRHAPGRDRDRELILFIARHGIVDIGHVEVAMGVGTQSCYRRVAACIERGLLERFGVVRCQPSLLRATRDGLRYVGLGLKVAQTSPGQVEHWLRCTSLAQQLDERYGEERIFTERELAFAERLEGAPIASAKVGELPNGRPQLHRPDVVILASDQVIAVELELTTKGPRRLEELIRSWRRARWVSGVHYYCEPGQTLRAVERAVTKVRAEEHVSVFEAPPR